MASLPRADIHQECVDSFVTVFFPHDLQLAFLNAAQLKPPLTESKVANYNVIMHHNECLPRDQ